MQQFFVDYGLWLLIGLLVVIALVFLVMRGGSTEAADTPATEPAPETPAPLAQQPAAIVGDLPAMPPVEAAPAIVEAVPAAAVPVEPVSAEPAIISSTPIPPSPSIANPSDTDDLLRLKGIGPKLNALLISLGVTRFEQIANWTDADVARVDAQLGTFKGRPVRDQWIDQARYLATGDVAGFEAKYGKL